MALKMEVIHASTAVSANGGLELRENKTADLTLFEAGEYIVRTEANGNKGGGVAKIQVFDSSGKKLCDMDAEPGYPAQLVISPTSDPSSFLLRAPGDGRLQLGADDFVTAGKMVIKFAGNNKNGSSTGILVKRQQGQEYKAIDVTAFESGSGEYEIPVLVKNV